MIFWKESINQNKIMKLSGKILALGLNFNLDVKIREIFGFYIRTLYNKKLIPSINLTDLIGKFIIL